MFYSGTRIKISQSFSFPHDYMEYVERKKEMINEEEDSFPYGEGVYL